MLSHVSLASAKALDDALRACTCDRRCLSLMSTLSTVSGEKRRKHIEVEKGAERCRKVNRGRTTCDLAKGKQM